DPDDVGVMQFGEELGLLKESFQSRPATQLGVEHLHSEQTLKSSTPSQAAQIDAPHPPPLEASENIVTSDPGKVRIVLDIQRFVSPRFRARFRAQDRARVRRIL